MQFNLFDQKQKSIFAMENETPKFTPQTVNSNEVEMLIRLKTTLTMPPTGGTIGAGTKAEIKSDPHSFLAKFVLEMVQSEVMRNPSLYFDAQGNPNEQAIRSRVTAISKMAVIMAASLVSNRALIITDIDNQIEAAKKKMTTTTA